MNYIYIFNILIRMLMPKLGYALIYHPCAVLRAALS